MSGNTRKCYRLNEAAQRTGANERVIIEYIRKEWIRPAETQEPVELDEEDLARVRLIRELLEDFGVNDPSVPIILHLLDQLNRLRWEARRAK